MWPTRRRRGEPGYRVLAVEMNDEAFALASQLVSSSYIGQAQQARRARESMFKSLLAQRRLPDNGWDEGTLRLLLEELALMDSNAFVGNAGVGEREARVICPLVRARHFGLGHGIGRSGDIAEEQPKAAGSSLIYKLTNALTSDALRRAGATGICECLVLPVATGMTVTLTLLALRQLRPGAHYVVWPRIDQKSCLKAVSAAGCVPLVIENILDGDELRTDVDAVRARIVEVGASEVLCVLSTTSCFAPRGVDKLLELGRLCAEVEVPHVANNAYGVQCPSSMKAIAAASRHGRLDAFIQSTDKNFLVPVGGAIVASCSASLGKALIAKVSATYPGRASVAPILDLLMTLLHLGADGWERLLADRLRLLPLFRERLAAVAVKHGERLLETPHNSISMAVTLSSGGGGRNPTAMGATLWVRLVSGARICAPSSSKKSVAGIGFQSYGSHCDDYPMAYFTAACALGVTEADIDLFLKRLDKTLREWKKMKPLPPPKPREGPPVPPPLDPTPPHPPQAEGGAPTKGERGAPAAAAAVPDAAPRPTTATPPPPAPQAAEGMAAAASSRQSTPADESTAAPAHGFVIRSERSAYKRFLQVEERVVVYPDGREASFDIVGHPKNNYAFVVVFAYHCATRSVTLLREFVQAAPPDGATALMLPTGGFDPRRHGSLLGAAKAELSEEAHLCGGEWHALLPDGHPGVLESKWCRNRFTPFLCVDPAADSSPGQRDAEEHIELLPPTPLAELRLAMAAGELLPPSLQTCFSALEWLAKQGIA